MFKKLIDHAGGFLVGSIIATVLLLVLLQFGQLDRNGNQDLTEGQKIEKQNPPDSSQKSPSDQPAAPADHYDYDLSVRDIEDSWWIDLEELAGVASGEYKVDEVNGTVLVTLFDIPFSWVKDVPVVERNGVFLPYEWKPVFEEKKVFVPLEFLQHGLEIEPMMDEGKRKVFFSIETPTEEVFSQFREKGTQLDELSTEELVEYLSFLTNPIPGAMISTRESHLPGARRAYRNGYHEGIDWYSGATGTTIDLNTKVLSVADGVVVRADLDYIEFEKDEREAYLTLAGELHETPTYILDKLRGRSVWVQYDHGVMVRYAHLSKIEEGIYVGKEVKRGETLGYVGNSGTSFAVNDDPEGGLHLHADLLIYGELFWKYIHEPQQIRNVLIHTFKERSQ